MFLLFAIEKKLGQAALLRSPRKDDLWPEAEDNLEVYISEMNPIAV